MLKIKNAWRRLLRMSVGRAGLVTLMAGGSLLAGLAQAQVGRGLADRSEVVEVTVVNVDIVALDRDGRPVLGLERDDFQVFDDRKRVEISYFSPPDRPNPSPSERLTLVFVVDQLHLRPESRDAVLPELKTFAGRLMSGGDVYSMVAVLDGRLRIIQDMTTSAADVAVAFNQIEARDEATSQAKNLKRRSQQSFEKLMEMLGGSARESVQGIASMETTLSELVGYGRVLQEDALVTADALGSLVESLALVPGRKALVLVGDGFAMRPFDRLALNLQRRVSGTRNPEAQDLMRRGESDGVNGFDDESNRLTFDTPAPQSARLRAGRFQESIGRLDCLPRFENLAALASSHRVTLFPIKPPEIEAAAAALRERVSDARSLGYLSDLRSGLLLLADHSGGLAMVSGDNVAAYLSQVEVQVAAPYSIGYVLDDFVEGSLHEVRVKTRGRVDLRYRTRYAARSLRNWLVDRTSGALLLGWTENSHDLRIDRIEHQTAMGGFYDVELTVSMPLATLALSSAKGMRAGQVRLAAAVQTEDRKRLEPQHLVLPLEIPAGDWDQARDQFFAVTFEFPLPRGRHLVAVGLWDEGSGRSSFLRQEFTVR